MFGEAPFFNGLGPDEILRLSRRWPFDQLAGTADSSVHIRANPLTEIRIQRSLRYATRGPPLPIELEIRLMSLGDQRFRETLARVTLPFGAFDIARIAD